MGEDRIRDAGRDERITVAEASERLGITKEAVRKRISRQTLRSDKDQDGMVWVYIPPSSTSSSTASEAIGRGELVELLRAQLEDLRADRDAWRDQARRSDYMASAAMDRTRELESRIRELEAPSEPRESPEQATSRDRVFWQQARRVGIWSLVFILGVLSIVGVGLITLLAPSFPLSLVRSGWGYACFALFLLPIAFGYLYGANRAQDAPPPFIEVASVAVVIGLGVIFTSLIAIGMNYQMPVDVDVFLLYRLIPGSALALAATLFVLSSMLIGVAKTRHGREPAGAGFVSWTPKKQLILGCVGNFIAAFFAGILIFGIQVLAS